MAEIRTISNIMSVDEGIITTVGGETFDASEVLGGLAGGTQYTIAPSNAVNKDRADLILTGTDDAAAINAAFTALVALRASDDVAVRVDFLGGDIEVEETIEIPTNFRIYGNGVNLIGEAALTEEYLSVIDIANGCTVYIEGINTSNGYIGIENSGAVTINNCAFNSAGECGIYNAGTATINNCNCNSNNHTGIRNSGTATINDCNCSDNSYYGIDNYGTNSIIVGNRCLNNTYANIFDEGTDTVLANNIAPEVSL
jgi:hypothetical protein